ncbi:alcohol dehydrogenase [Aphelenchoides bicaudatus]|nr:alcohol dehydrogenase [Aphelenchoides bicaudatus]
MTKVGYIEMSNGQKAASIRFRNLAGEANDHEQLKTALREALNIGYRYIDTATAYGNESAIGEVLKEFYDAGKLKREDIFLTTKLPFYGHEPKVAQQILEQSLKNLHTNYLDLWLIHAPTPTKPNEDISGSATDGSGKMVIADIPLINTWRVFEEHYKAGVCKSIGISNFNAQQVKELCSKAEVKPHNLQIELHIFFNQKEMRKVCEELDITITSYSTLGSPGRSASKAVTVVEGADCLNHPLVKELAHKYEKTPAQILLRHAIQLGVNVIPKSTNPDRLKENFDVFDFEISTVDQQRLENIDEQKRLLTLDFLKHSPNYPFHDSY